MSDIPSPPDRGNTSILLDSDDPQVAAVLAMLTDPSTVRMERCHDLREKLNRIIATAKDVTGDACAAVMEAALATAKEWEAETLAVRRIGFDPVREKHYELAWDDYCKKVGEFVRHLQDVCDKARNASKPEWESVKEAVALNSKKIDELATTLENLGLKPAETQGGGYTKARLREITGLSNTTLSSYAKAAGVPIATKGGRNYRYPIADVRTILQWIIDTSSEHALVERCKKAIVDLPKSRNNREITEISR